jgi:hypothetical protein
MKQLFQSFSFIPPGQVARAPAIQEDSGGVFRLQGESSDWAKRVWFWTYLELHVPSILGLPIVSKPSEFCIGSISHSSHLRHFHRLKVIEMTRHNYRCLGERCAFKYATSWMILLSIRCVTVSPSLYAKG